MSGGALPSNSPGPGATQASSGSGAGAGAAPSPSTRGGSSSGSGSVGPTLLARPGKVATSAISNSHTPPRVIAPADVSGLSSGLASLKVSSPSAASSSTSALPPVPSVLDETLCDALRSSKDRLFLLRQEQNMIDFIANPDGATDHVLPLMNSYQRLLVHRCADYYSLHRDVDTETKVVKLSRTAETRIPPLRITQLFDRMNAAPRPGDVSPFAMASTGTNQPLAGTSRSGDSSPSVVDQNGSPAAGALPGPSSFRIMRRDPSMGTRGIRAGATGSGDDGTGSEPGKKSRRDMTIEERETAYREARERIFGASLAETEESANSVGGSLDVASRSKGSIAHSPLKARAPFASENATVGTLSSTKGSEAGHAHSREDFRPSGTLANPYTTSGMPPLPYHPTHYDSNGNSFGSQAAEIGRYSGSSTGFDRGPVWPHFTPQQQQPPPFHAPPWSQYQQHAQQQMPSYPQNAGPIPQAMYQYPYPQPTWQNPQQNGLFYAQNPSGNGSTSNLSSFDAFSPFPPTPSTNSSVGIPSPAPSVSGSSNSAVSRRGGRGNVEGDAQRRGSRASSSSESLGVSRPGGAAGGQTGFSSLPHGRQQQQQQQFGDLQASSVSTSRSASPASTRLQPVEGRRMMASAGSGSSGRLNVGDRSLFDPNRAGAGTGDSPTQAKSVRPSQGANIAAPIPQQQQTTTPHYPPQQSVIAGGYVPVPWPPSAAPFVPSQQQQGGYQQQLPMAMGYYGLPPAAAVSDMPLRYPAGVASPPTLSTGLQARPLQHTIGSSSIRLGSVLPAQAIPSSPIVAPESESTQHAHQQGQGQGQGSQDQGQSLVAGTFSPPASIPGLPARPDWVLNSLNTPHDVRSAALASLPGNAQGAQPASAAGAAAAAASKASEPSGPAASAPVPGSGSGSAPGSGALEPGSLATTPRSSVRSLNGYIMSDRSSSGVGEDEVGSIEGRSGALLLSDKMARAGLSSDVDVDTDANQNEDEEEDEDDESAESSSLGPSASASNVGGDDESEGAAPACEAGDEDEDDDDDGDGPVAPGEADRAGPEGIAST